ncbi:hypothetical protein GPJ56_006559 [Histomonas meleagridis]|uniref:uncharacterized protein n=1 Tax=Histomonas meleagridis TaxID=135588 RepID=UPI003559BF0D|nr:hypothetical protein GPJ56_006559 [Histomonas meleagridis]KAH0800164.1 hypothetical protein GO595_007276 [Histomonas meleagridis]
MGCFCSCFRQADEPKVEQAKEIDIGEFVNKDEPVRDTSTLLQQNEVKAIAIDDSSSSSSVNQEMIQKLLDEIDDFSDNADKS